MQYDEQLLSVQLQHTEFLLQDEGESDIPFAATQADLRFHHLAHAHGGKEASDEALLWRLGHALLDEVDIAVPTTAPLEVRRRAENFKRSMALSEWFEAASKSSMETDLRGGDHAENDIFTLLTGHQVTRACALALQTGNVRLSTLLAQAGGDREACDDVARQLQQWRDERTDAHISTAQRRVYELLSGNVNTSAGRRGNGPADTSETIDIGANLDWKRALASRFWYGSDDHDYKSAMASYDRAVKQGRAAEPLPVYALEDRSGSAGQLRDSEPITDALYNLLKLSADPTLSIESVLLPRSFNSSPIDFRLPWHLAMLLARAMQVRGFTDADVDNKFSITAEELTASYAAQLEEAGYWEWAVFVYMHLVLRER